MEQSTKGTAAAALKEATAKRSYTQELVEAENLLKKLNAGIEFYKTDRKLAEKKLDVENKIFE